MKDLSTKVFDQALKELPQLDPIVRQKIVEDYINSMTNIELLALISRSDKDKG